MQHCWPTTPNVHCWIKNATYCVRVHTLLHVVACCWELLRVVGSCCAKFETPGQTFGPVKRDTRLLGVVASVITYNCSFKCIKELGLLPYGLWGQGQFTLLIRSRVS